MTDATVAVREYETAAELSESLSRALLDLKRIHHELPSAASLTTAQRDASRRTLLAVVTAIESTVRVDAAFNPAEAGRRILLPAGLVDRLLTASAGDAVTAPDLARVRLALMHPAARLSAADLGVLDRIADAVDRLTIELFARVAPAPAQS